MEHIRPKDIHVISSNYTRTQLSAQVLLCGLLGHDSADHTGVKVNVRLEREDLIHSIVLILDI